MTSATDLDKFAAAGHVLEALEEFSIDVDRLKFTIVNLLHVAFEAGCNHARRPIQIDPLNRTTWPIEGELCAVRFDAFDKGWQVLGTGWKVTIDLDKWIKLYKPVCWLPLLSLQKAAQ